MPLQTSAEYKDEQVATLYGINPESHDVETITLSRGMTLTRFRGDKYPTTYKIRHGLPADGQVARVFGLTDVIRIDLATDPDEHDTEHPDLTRLRALAAKRKAHA